MTVVVDASVLIVLAKLMQIELLKSLFDSVVVPQAVLDEVLHPAHADSPEAPAIRRAVEAGWLVVASAEPPVDADQDRLGAGELAAIQLGLRDEAALVLIDDAVARRIARSRGLNVSGTLGVLAAAERAGLLSDIQTLPERLRAAGFFVSDEALKVAGLLH